VIVARTPAEYYFGANCRLAESDLRLLAPELPSLPTDFQLYACGRYRGRTHLANYSRRVEFYGQLQRCLKKVDMASMHHSLEVRVPLLDRNVLDISLRLDPFDCMRNGDRKVPLRNLLARHVPAEAIPTSKRGFSVPLGAWLRGPLRPLVEEAFTSGGLFPSGVFDQQGLRHYWEDHLSGRRDHKWGLWTLLSLQWWARTHLQTRALTYA
jgi:asparagine synthase (glutamine-hydrolysing)